MPDPTVAAIVLAAGSSRRMGRNKLLLHVGGESLVRRVVRAAVEADVGRVVVVLGHDAETVRAELGGLPCTPVVNPDHGEGAGTSLRTGVRHAAEAQAVVVVLADMPFVTAEMIGAVARRHRDTGAPLVLSQYGDVQAPPTLYARPLFSELLTLEGDRGGKEVAGRHVDRADVVHWPPSALRDVDGPDDYERLRAEWTGRH